jgi:hypothetical protein
MNEFLLLLAKFAPEDELMNRLMEAIKEHRLLKSEEAKANVEFLVLLYSAKISMQKKDVKDVILEAKRFESYKNMFNGELKN